MRAGVATRCEAADRRRHAKHRQHLVRHVQREQLLRVGLAAERRRPVLRGAHRRKAARVTLPVEVIGRRDRIGPPVHHDDERVRVLVVERSQEHGVDDAEGRRGRADAERERHHDGQVERRRASHHPQAVADILTKPIEEGARADVANRFLDLLDASRFEERRAARRLRRHALRDLLFGEQCDVRVELVVHAVVGHGVPRSAWPSAVTTLRHSAVSVSSWRRPLAVSW